MNAAASIGAALAAAAFALPSTASAHQNRCHQSHACPSDHATYAWGPKRLWCVRPTADERTSRFKTRVVYDRLTYFCRR